MVAGRVFSQLCEDVLSGRYEPGEKLPTQRTLAAELDVNMASVREAVKRLEQLGLVEVRHGDAMRVTDWRASGSLDVIAHVLFAAGGLDRDTLAHLMEARRLMLAESARLAAERRRSGAPARRARRADRRERTLAGARLRLLRRARGRGRERGADARHELDPAGVLRARGAVRRDRRY
jgi:GntR family transcriptional repressor for pyruvate dehydrogenase complex